MFEIKETKFDFMKYRRFWVGVSFAFIAAAIVGVFVVGKLNVGIDFTGGTQIELRFAQPVDIDRLRSVVSGAGVGESVIQRSGPVERNEVMIRTPLTESLAEGSAAPVLAALRSSFGEAAFTVLSSENVGPVVGAELRQKGLLAVVWSLVGMLVYIWVRFELRFGVGAMMATVHDVIVTLGLFTFAGFEFNLTTIAAFLTLVGYSVNDTVVVFDRVRENMRRMPSAPLVETMNKSINQTLSRTLLTGGTTIMACVALMIWGGDVLRGFAFILTVGVVVGTYSSIYIASPFALLWEQVFGRHRAGKAAASPTPRPTRPAAPR